MTTSLDYSKPYRPVPLKIGNGIMRLLNKIGIAKVDLSAEFLMAKAKKEVSLDDFGDMAFLEPMRILIESIEAEANLTPFGRMVQQGRMIGLLKNRLLVQEAVKCNPEILQEKIEAPLVIVGLQRTGTTMLHRMLAQDASNLTMAWWQGGNPAPGAIAGNKEADTSEDPRILAAEKQIKALAYLNPDFMAIHPMDARAADEEILLLDFSFISTTPEAAMHVPSYAKWLEGHDNTPAYEYLKLLLQYLQWQDKKAGNLRKRWVLKTPHHLEYLDILLKTFPGAKLIQTHRDPVQTLASFCSMIAVGRGLGTDHVDPIEIGQHWGRKVSLMMDKTLAVRDKIGDSYFIDVNYKDVITDPVAEIRRIYTAIGDEVSVEFEQAIQCWRQENDQHKHGKHEYKLEDFGLNEDNEKQRFLRYRQRFIH